jgi:hypothetical protein
MTNPVILDASSTFTACYKNFRNTLYQVEFTTFDGRTVAVAKVSTDQIRPLGDKEIHHARAFEPATR